MNHNYEQAPEEHIMETETRHNVLMVASLYSLIHNGTYTIGQFVGNVYRDLDIKDILKNMLSIEDDLTLFRTLFYLNYKGEELKPKSLYKIFRNGQHN